MFKTMILMINLLGDDSFQRKTGYVQQQDLHLPTATVRETLEFSALLRQPSRYSKQEKLAYVDEVITMLEMQSYRDAVVGIPGEGLNVEQRKRLTIGVELVARPALLLFLDEPTSGLDSQTSWSIVNLLTKLSKSGQAVLCTIHQPSAILFQRFDRLLLLAKGKHRCISLSTPTDMQHRWSYSLLWRHWYELENAHRLLRSSRWLSASR
jgi:ABC-type multidrug transport system ATPase subunit